MLPVDAQTLENLSWENVTTQSKCESKVNQTYKNPTKNRKIMNQTNDGAKLEKIAAILVENNV